MLKVINSVALLKLLGVANRARTDVFKALSLADYTYDVDFCDDEDLPKTCAVEKLTELTDPLPPDSFYNSSKQSSLKNRSNDVLPQTSVHDFYNLEKRMIQIDRHGKCVLFDTSSSA